jgi:hypothetical protein
MADTDGVARSATTKVLGLVASTLLGLALLGNALVAGDGVDAEWLDVLRKGVSVAFVVALVAWLTLVLRDHAHRRRRRR